MPRTKNGDVTIDIDGDVLVPYVPRICLEWPEGTTHQRVEGTLLSADIAGFTALAERLTGLGREGAEELTRLLNERFAKMIGEVEARGGDVLKFGGDALLCLFRGEDHVTHALSAAQAMREVISRSSRTRAGGMVNLAIAIGAHAGPIDLFVVDAGRHRELILAGPGAAATIAAESAAERGEILLDSPVYPRTLQVEKTRNPRRHRIVSVGEAVDDPPASSQHHLGRPADFLPPSQVERIAAGVGATGEHRLGVIGFLHVTGACEVLVADGPEAAASAIEDVAQVVSAACDRYGVNWLGTDVSEHGFKVIVAGGVPTGGTDDETALLMAMRDIVETELPLSVAIGANRGAVFASDLGGPTRRTFTVMGDPVNLAARLMAKAEPGQVVAHAAVLARTTRVFHHDPIPPFKVKGKTSAVDASVVGNATLERRAPRRSAPAFVGRQEEMGALSAAWALAKGGHGQVVHVHGSPGTGRTRLLAEFARLHASGARALRTRGEAHAQQRPYGLVHDLVRTACAIPLTASPAEAGRALRDLVHEVMPESLSLLPLLAVAAGAAVEDTVEARRVRAEFAADLIVDLVGQLLLRTVGEQQAVFLIDDADLGDDASLVLLERLAGQFSGAPWLMVLASKGADDLWATEHSVALEPLDDHDLARLVDDVSRIPLTNVHRNDIVVRAAGNPLFAVELTDAHAAGIDVPESIEASVSARFDQLPALARATLLDLSVLGTSVDLALVHAVFGAKEGVARALDWVPLNDFVSVAGDSVTFRQGIFQSVAYQSLSYQRRRLLHAAAGAALEAVDPDDHVVLSHHYDAAGVHDEAWKHSVLAAQAALASFGAAEAVRLYQRALRNGRRVLTVDRGELGRVAETLGDVAELAAEYSVAREAFAEARKAFNRQLVADVRLRRKIGELIEREGRYSQALSWYSRASRLVDDHAGEAAPALRCDLSIARSGVRYRQARYDEAAALAQQAAHDARLAGDTRSLGHAYYLLDLCSTYGGHERGGWAARALSLFEEAGDGLYQAHCLNQLGVAAYFSGDWVEAAARYRQAATSYGEIGAVRSEAIALGNLGELLSDQFDLDGAESAFKSAIRTFDAVGYRLGLAVNLGNLGRLRIRQGRHSEALDDLQATREHFEELGSAYYLAVTDLRLAERAAELGDMDEVARLLDSLEADRPLDPPGRVAAKRLKSILMLASEQVHGAQEQLEFAKEEARDNELAYELGLCLLMESWFPSGHAPQPSQAWAVLEPLGVRRSVSLPGLARVVDAAATAFEGGAD